MEYCDLDFSSLTFDDCFVPSAYDNAVGKNLATRDLYLGDDDDCYVAPETLRYDRPTRDDLDSYTEPTTNATQTSGEWIRADHNADPCFDQELIDHSEKIVDLVIVMDCTGSMSGEIEVAKSTVTTIINSLHEKFQTDLRFSAISYRDHTDDYAVKEYPFTKDVQKAKSYVSEMSAQGGGDTPEACASALQVLNEMPFNKKGKKLVVWVADAPAHGMNSPGDSYPEGCKDKEGNVIDWIKLGSALQEKNVVFYGIICERSKSDQQLTLFMDYLATRTDGKCLLLLDANKIPNLIINGCVEDEEMDNLVAQKIKELGEEKTKNMALEELIQHIHNESSNAKVTQVKTLEIASTNTKKLMAYSTLADIQDDDFTNVTNFTTRCDDCEEESGDLFNDYAGVYYKAPTMEKVSKAYSRNLRK